MQHHEHLHFYELVLSARMVSLSCLSFNILIVGVSIHIRSVVYNRGHLSLALCCSSLCSVNIGVGIECKSDFIIASIITRIGYWSTVFGTFLLKPYTELYSLFPHVTRGCYCLGFIQLYMYPRCCHSSVISGIYVLSCIAVDGILQLMCFWFSLQSCLLLFVCVCVCVCVCAWARVYPLPSTTVTSNSAARHINVILTQSGHTINHSSGTDRLVQPCPPWKLINGNVRQAAPRQASGTACIGRCSHGALYIGLWV